MSTSPAVCLRSQVQAGMSKRDDFPLQPSKAALLVIDVQTYLTTPPPNLGDQNLYFWKYAAPRMVRNLTQLVQRFRNARDGADEATHAGTTTGCEVIFIFLQAATKDGRDISLDYKLSGPELAAIPRVNDTGELFLPELRPDLTSGKGDILVPKTSCSVFQSTNLDYLLRNLGIIVFLQQKPGCWAF